MKWINRLSLRQKFLIAPLIGVMLLGIPGGAIIYNVVNDHREILRHIMEDDLKTVGLLGMIQTDYSLNHGEIHEFLSRAGMNDVDEEEASEFGKPLLNTTYRILERLTETAALDFMDTEQVLIQQDLLAVLVSYRESITKAIEMATVDVLLAHQYIQAADASFTKANDQFLLLAEAMRADMNEEILDEVVASNRQKNLFNMVFFATIICVILIGMALSNLLSRDIQALIQSMTLIADGEKKPEIPKGLGQGEIGAMAEALMIFSDNRTRLDELSEKRLSDNEQLKEEINSRKMAEEKLEQHAYYDGLTQLPNKVLFMDKLDQTIARSKRHKDYLFAVLYLDLDRFKKVNDSFGHSLGDDLLVLVAERLKTVLRASDSIARMGGDEFIILLDEIKGEADVRRVTDRIHLLMKQPVRIADHDVVISSSVGVVFSGEKHMAPEDLLRDADIAMYRAKESGTSKTVIFDEKMHEKVMLQLRMEMDLRRAIEEEQFIVYYQPIVESSSRSVLGFEALVRWQHPEKGLVPPFSFIPVAEQTGLINEIGYYVLKTACYQLKSWLDLSADKPSLYVSVNVSSKQFLQADLVQQVDKILEETQLPSENLRLEITESLVIENPKAANAMLAELKARGIRLYMDDFGTGYSSLSNLQNLPFDTLKVDRSFTKELGLGSERETMVSLISDIAKNFGMGLIIEGVETDEQLVILNEMGCYIIQGYYFSPPVPVDEASEMLLKPFALKV